MTEDEWLACADPNSMLQGGYFQENQPARKLWLFAIACCRRVGHLLDDDRFEAALNVLEMRAEGKSTSREVAAAYKAAKRASNPLMTASNRARSYPSEAFRIYAAASAVVGALNGGQKSEHAGTSAYLAAREAARTAFPNDGTERVAQCHLLLDVFGNPFRPVVLAPSWRTPTVTALATAAYEERHLPAGTLDSDRLAVLADALEDAGCTDEQVLAHLRGPGPHVRGCWALDLLLGKE